MVGNLLDTNIPLKLVGETTDPVAKPGYVVIEVKAVLVLCHLDVVAR